MKITLYGTSACHLCEQASSMLMSLCSNYDFSVIEIDIIESDALLAEYGMTIPVLLRADNQEKLYWPFTVEDIRIFITA